MDELLGRLKGDGSYHSSGTFTLDVQSAIARLQNDLFLSESDYLYRLVAIAVQSRASRFNLGRIPGGIELSWDGEVLEREQLARLFDLGSRVDRMYDLTVAMLAMLKLCPRVEVLSGTTRLTLERGRLELEQAPLAQNTVRMRGMGRLRSWWHHGSLESDYLRVCRLAPLRFREESSLPELNLGSLYRVRIGAPPLPLVGKVHLELPGTPWGDGYLLVSDESTESVPLDIHHCGVRIFCWWRPNCPGTRLFWWTDNLPLDLPRTSWVQNEVFRAFQEFIHQELTAAARRWPSEEREKWLAEQD